MQRFVELSQEAFGSSRHHQRTTRMLISQLVCLGRHSITGLISTAGRQALDWAADCRLYSRRRFDQDAGFATVRNRILKALPDDQPFIVGIDDTIVRKAGKRTHGSKWRRDPLGPPFQINLVRAQRFFQISAALPLPNQAFRMLPIDLVHSPTRPGTDDPSVTQVAVSRLHALRNQLDEQDPSRPLWVVADGGYTNQTVLRNLPERTALIGRVRKDAKLSYPPEEPRTKGRRRVYGEDAPRPQELARDKTVAWEQCYVSVGAKQVRFRYKTIAGLKSRKAGGDQTLRLIVVAPRRYKRRKTGRLLYKSEAFLICTDPDAPIRDILRAYLYRWDVEVNFREVKSILGMEEALVRTEASTQLHAASVAIAYGFLHLAHAEVQAEPLPRPKWRKTPEKPKRITTTELLQILRQQLWFESIESFSDFAHNIEEKPKPEKLDLSLRSAVIYACSA